jgi:predicted CXXCH cytochrome family protein
MRSPTLVALHLAVWAAQALQTASAADADAITGAASKNAQCLNCHAPIAEQLKQKSVHRALEMGCESCHVDHLAGGAKNKPPHFVNAAQPALCAGCHDLKGETLVKAHEGQPLDKALCTGCHNPHSSPNAKLIAARQHLPFADRQCEKCHQAPQGGKVKLVASSISELCEGCHVQFKKRLEEAQVQHTALQLDDDSCITCHRAHASQEPALLKARAINLCITCHTDKPGNKKYVHDPAATNCAICHDPHGSNFHVHLRADVNTLCNACHSLRPPTQNSEGERLVMPAGFPERATKIYVDSTNRGHPNIGHPVSGNGIGPNKDQPLTCISCHTPHSGDTVQRFVGELRGTALCLSCHGKK